MVVIYHPTTPVVKSPAMVWRGSKQALIRAMLQRPKGATQAELLAATGWSAINIVREAQKHGLRLHRRSERGPNGKQVTRYFARQEAFKKRAERMLAQAAQLCRINRTLIQRLDQLVGNKERLLDAAIRLEAAE